MAKPNPGPWEYSNVHVCADRDAYGVVKDANGKILFDTINSDVAEIYTEHDESGVNRIDEQAKANLTLAALGPEFLEACKAFLALWDTGTLNTLPVGVVGIRTVVLKAEGLYG